MALVRIDVSEEGVASIMMVECNSEVFAALFPAIWIIPL
jgi:hypothetical protein